MLRLSIYDEEFDNDKNEFFKVNEVVLELEHSLISLSKWESFFEKPFLSPNDKTFDEMVWYIEAMTLTEEIPPEVFSRLSPKNFEEINEYLGAKMSATTFNDINSRPSRDIITSEVIYHWMIAHHIPFECATWHLNRLFTLIRVCNEKSAAPKKMSQGEVLKRNHDLNAQRKREMGTAG